MVKFAQEKFSISYDADKGDYKEHEIDARTLGRSILGVYDMVAEASALINKGAEVDLKVTSPVKEGSVIVEFLLLAATPGALEVLKYIGLSAAGGAIAGGSLIEIVKKIKNRRISKVTIENDSDIAIIEVDGVIIKCNKYVAKLAIDKKVRNSLHNVVQAPISGRDDAKFKILDSTDKVIVKIDEEAAHDFSPLPSKTLEQEEVTKEETTAYFVQINFESKNGWRVKLGDGTEHAVKLADENFLAKVNQNKQSFSKEDLFGVTLEKKATYRQTRSTYEYTVIEVTKHFVEKDRRLF